MEEGRRSPARLLETARRDCSLSALSRRLGLARATLRELEAGGDPRLSTLEACARELPGFTPPALSGETPPRVPPLLGEIWEAQRNLLGAWARRRERLVVEQADGSLRVEETVTEARPAPGTPSVSASDLMQRLHPGPRAPLSRALARGGPPDGEPLELEHEGHRWVYRVSGSSAKPRVDLHATWRLPEPTGEGDAVATAKALGLWLAPELPVRELVLAWQPRDGARPRAGLQPRALRLGPGELRAWTEACAAGCRPQRRQQAADGAWETRASRLPVGLALTLLPASEGREPAPAARRGPALRRAREAAGLSVRELARRAGLSPQTLSGAETGRTDPRLSSLLALTEALPQLSCWSLLPWPAGAPAEQALFDWSAAAFGCLVEEEHKEVELSASGGLRIRIHFRGLRRLRPGSEDLAIVLGAAKTVLQRQAAELDEVSEDEPAGLRIARLGGEPGPAQFVVRVPGEAADAPPGVSFTRRFVNPGSHAMTAERARELTGHDGTFHEGTIMGPLVPARRSVLSVRFPRGYRPLDLRASAWAMNQAPDPEGEDLAPRLGESAPRLEWDSRRRRARVESDRLPLGFKLALSWRLP